MFPLLHLLLTLLWAGLLGAFSAETLLSGAFVSAAVLLLVGRGTPACHAYFGKFLKIATFLAYYLREFIKSNLVIAYEIITPPHTMKPGVVGVPLRAQTDLEIALLANLITMTPGTLSLDVSDDRRTLYVHAMYVEDPEALRREIIDNLERRVLEILR